MADLTELDQLVSDYLVFRQFYGSARQLNIDRASINASDSIDVDTKESEVVLANIEHAMHVNDCAQLLTLWDKYVVQTLELRSESIIAAARATEFNLHVYCATHPFRPKFISSAQTPNAAAVAAARSMTIFKHFVEFRGKPLLKNPDFSVYKNLHKIAFPPTHPSFTFLFRDGWDTLTKESILKFLKNYLHPDPPALYILYTDNENDKSDKANAREEEIKNVFKHREMKLMQFSRSIYDISQELLNKLEDGKIVDKEYLLQFRQKFDEFSEILEPSNVPQSDKANNKRKMKKMESKVYKKDVNVMKLNFGMLSLDLQSMVKEVEAEVSKHLVPNTRVMIVDAEIAEQSSLQASALLEALVKSIQQCSVISNGISDEEDSVQGMQSFEIARHIMQQDIFKFGVDIFRKFKVSDVDVGLEDAYNGECVIILLHSLASGIPYFPLNSLLSSSGTYRDDALSLLFIATISLIYSWCRFTLIVLEAALPGQLLVTFKDQGESDDDNASVVALYNSIINVLVLLPNELLVKQQDSFVCHILSMIVILGHSNRCKTQFVNAGGLKWIAETLKELIKSNLEGTEQISIYSDYVLTLCCAVINSLVEVSDIKNLIFGSSRSSDSDSIAVIARSLMSWLGSSMKLQNAVDNKYTIASYFAIKILISILNEDSLLQCLQQQNEIEIFRQSLSNEICSMRLGPMCQNLLIVLENAQEGSNVPMIENADRDEMMEKKFTTLLRDIIKSSTIDSFLSNYYANNPKENSVKILARYL
jgi:hypothetical protein